MKKLLLFLAVLFVSLPCLALDDISIKAMIDRDYDGKDLKLVRVLLTSEAYTRYYITYMSGKYRISGIMNIPKDKGPFPVMILNHGYINPKYYTNGRGLKREQDYLAKNGYAVLHPDYRNHNGSDKDPNNQFRLNLGYTEDVINAVMAVKRSNIKQLDKENIGMLGHSLGGGIALNIMAIKPGLIKAYVLFAPISMDYRDNYEKWIKRRSDIQERKLPTKYGDTETRHRLTEVYGTPDTNPAFWDGLSVTQYLDRFSEPIEIHHGMADDSVPIEWSDKLQKALKKNGKDITLYQYVGQPHEFTSSWGLVMKRTVNFLDGYLKIGKAKKTGINK